MKARGSADWDQVSCMRCGARDFEVTRPGWVEGLREWLSAGGPWRPTRQVCRRCGTAGTTGSFGRLVGSRRGWRSVPMVPIHLLGILRQRRAMIPVPATYLMALVAGGRWGRRHGVAVLLLHRVLGRRGLQPAGCHRGPAGGEPTPGHGARPPAGGRAVPGRPFPLYGLPPSWSGPRQLGGWGERWDQGRRRPVTTALTLAHGDPLAEEGPQLRVEVESYREREQVLPVRSERRPGLARELWWAAAPTAHDVAEHWDEVAAAHRRPDPVWYRVTIPVDGRPVGFQWLAEGRHWVALAELEDRALTLRGRDLPVELVELVRVLDLEPYIQGQRRLQEAWARHDAEEH